MSNYNRNASSIGKTSHSAINKKTHLVKPQAKLSARAPMKNKALLPKKEKWQSNTRAKYHQQATNIPHQADIVTKKKIKSKESVNAICTRSYDDINIDDPVTVLRKEIQDWRINEILTSRTEDRLTGTPSEHQTYSYGAL